MRKDALDNIEEASNMFVQCKNEVGQYSERVAIRLFRDLLECFEFIDMYPDYYERDDEYYYD